MILNGDPREGEFGDAVRREVALIAFQESLDVLLDHVECRIPQLHSGVGKRSGSDPEGEVGVDDEGDEATDHVCVGAVVSGVDRVCVAFNNASQNVNALRLAGDGDP